jgi:hypothetical protein
MFLIVKHYFISCNPNNPAQSVRVDYVCPLNLHQQLNKSYMLIGLGIPNNKWTTLHKKLAYTQSKIGVE